MSNAKKKKKNWTKKQCFFDGS